MKDNSISINIWDDYFDDGFVPEGEIQETYAYIESKLNDDDSKAVLELFKKEIEQLIKPEWNLTLSIEYYDSSKLYPSLIGTPHERHLYKRWQLEMKNITHEVRESLVEDFKNKQLTYGEMPLVIYSES